jgi:hypothetical protein
MAYGSWHTALPYTTMFTNQPPWPTAVGVHQQRLGNLHGGWTQPPWATAARPNRREATEVGPNLRGPQRYAHFIFFKKIKL